MKQMNQNQRGSVLAELYWDATDVNANLTRAEWVARAIGNGWHSGINFVVMFVLFLVALILAWQFDFHSTYDALAHLRQHILGGLPSWVGTQDTTDPTTGAKTVALVAAIITAIITVAPTLMEIFTSNLARANIFVIKSFVLGASAFDVITDIPTTKVWIDSWQGSFNALPGPIAWLVYWIAFFGWLFFATVGFQLAVVIFFYLMVIYFRKMTVGMPISYGPIPGNKPNNPQPKVKVQQPQVVKSASVTVAAEAADGD